jgi:hypothetical protein
MPTEVAFFKIEQVQQQTDLGSFQTSRYQRIRVLADCRFDSGTSVEILLVLVEAGGAPGRLDRFALGPGDEVQRVYEVPGTRIAVSVTPRDPGETANIDIWVWGYRVPGE